MQRIEFNQYEIKTGARSLCWAGDRLIDWVDGGTVLHLDGTIEHSSINYAFPFDACVTSPCGTYAALYQKLGTKGLVLREGEILREINRSFYRANVYEYPIAIYRNAEGRTLLAHCPEKYNRIELEDIESGKRIGKPKSKKAPDFFHSRLRASPDGRYLLSAGWVWHPWNTLEVYDLEAAASKPKALARAIAMAEYDLEVCAAEFLTDTEVLVAFWDSDDEDDEDEPGNPATLAVLDVTRNKFISKVATEDPIGNLMPINREFAVGFFDHPRLISMKTGKTIETWTDIDSGN